MPPIAVAAGITAIGALGGSAIQARSQSKATSEASRANREALAYQKEQEAARRIEYDKAMQQYEAKWNAWNESRNALLKRYGVDIGPSTPPQAAAPSVGAPGAPQMAPGMSPAMDQPTGAFDRARQLTRASATPGITGSTPGMTIADLMQQKGDLGGAFDWRQQGLA